MIKKYFIHLSQILLLTLSPISHAQIVAEKPAEESEISALTKAKIKEIFTKANEPANEDLSQLKHPVKPVLWKVEGKALKKPSYLFGSIHVGDKNITTLHPDAEAAYQQADTIATEVGMGLINQLRGTKSMTRNDGKTLKESIGEELHNEVNAEFAFINEALSTAPFENMKTWAITILLGVMDEAMKGGKSLDNQLWDRAGDDDKKRWALETIKQQLGGFDKMNEEEQIILLKDSILGTKLLRELNIKPSPILRKLYLKGQVEKIRAMFESLSKIEGSNQRVAKKFEKLILFDRNDRMAAKILEVFEEMPEKSHFIIAGAMHYVGDHSVVELLRKEGYKVTRQ